MPLSISFCLASCRASCRASGERLLDVVEWKPRLSAEALLSPSSMALMARKTSSLTVLMMSSSNVCTAFLSAELHVMRARGSINLLVVCSGSAPLARR